MTQSQSQTVRVWRTVAEAASLLGISVRTLERRLADGKYPVEYVNGKRLIDCQQDASDESRMLADSRAMGEEARAAAGMLTAMLQQSLAERTAEVNAARAETIAARKLTVRAWQAVAAAVVIVGILGAGLITYRNSDRHMADRVAELTAQLGVAEGDIEELSAKLERQRLAELADTRRGWEWLLGNAQ